MKGLALKYGHNPSQKLSRIYMKGGELPITVLNGRPGYVNFPDALNSWQLVKELKAATDIPSTTSFEHVPPARAAIGLLLNDTLKRIYFTDGVKMELSSLACAYARARGVDHMCSHDSFVTLSGTCDAATATLIKWEMSDGVIVPDYMPEALDILKQKCGGTYDVVQIDANYVPAPIERRQIFDIIPGRGYNDIQLDDDLLFMHIPIKNRHFGDETKRDLIIAFIILKCTQSSSVYYVKDGQVISIGAGQQSRIHHTRLVGQKANTQQLRQRPKVMDLLSKEDIRRADHNDTIDQYIGNECGDLLQDGTWQHFSTTKPEPFTTDEKKAWVAQNRDMALGSDALFPFSDNIKRAHKSGVAHITQAGGSIRDDHVTGACDKYGIAMAMISVRLFHR